MSMQDPVADMLTRIRNAQAMGIQKVNIPHSKLKSEMLNVLQQEGFIEGFEVVPNGKNKDLKVTLKYYQGRPVIKKIKRVSRPALRVYKGYDEFPVVRGGLELSLCPPKGVMADKVARAQKVGGEVLCSVE